MVRSATAARILCVVGLMLCAGGGARAGGLPLLISEFRLRGPVGATDEYIEVRNKLNVPFTVMAASGSGYGIAASDGVTRCTMPNGTVIPPYGHFLCVNSSGYSLGEPGDAAFTLDIPDNAGVALFDNNVGGSSYSPGTRVDAVGSTSETNTLYKEGAGYPALTVTLPRESAWVRLPYLSCAARGCTPQSPPAIDQSQQDFDDNAADFYYTDTTGGISIPDGRIQRLGAPGPENLSAPVSVPGAFELFPARPSRCSPGDMAPNRVRDLTPGPALTAPLGTLDLRVQWVNFGSVPITRLRFRIIDLTIFPVPFGTADLRAMSSDDVSFSVDSYPCGSPDGIGLARGTTLEQAALQPNGGGLNSTLSAGSVTPATPWTTGGVTFRLKFGVVQNGFARFCVVPETTPAVGVLPWCYIGSTAVSPARPVAGDYDFDHVADMSTYDPGTGRWTIWRSAGIYTVPLVLTFPEPGGTPVPGDYDGDGQYDPALYRRETGAWELSLSTTGYSRIVTPPRYGGPGFDPVPGDYDGDGTTDQAVASRTRGTWVIRPSSSLSGLDEVVRTFGRTEDTPVGGQDFDGDGLSDMVVYNERTAVWFLRGSAANFNETVVGTALGGIGKTLVPADYDGDARSDYGVYERATGTWTILLSGRGVTPPYTARITGGWGGPGYVPVPGDYDGDGFADVAVYQAAATTWLALTSSSGYSTPLARTFGTIADRPVSTAVLPASTREIHAGDFDGDGLNDINVYDIASGFWSRKESSDLFTATLTRSHGGTGFTAVPGDYDGDGRGDFAFYQPATGRWQVLRSLTNFAMVYDFGAGGPEWVPVAGDYDGDTRADMIVYNTTTGQWYGRLSGSNFASAISLHPMWGGPGYEPAPGDFDGDGRLDLSVYHAATGIWWILTSRSAYTAVVWRYYGGPGYAPVPADFDGDGFTDFAVYQAATGLWTILRSGTGNAQGYTIGYGGAGYTPVAGDWDGDRRADIAVYQTATGNWSIVLSGTGYMTSLPRTLGGPGRIPLPAFR